MAVHSAAFVKAHESAQGSDGNAGSVLTFADAARLARLNAPTLPAPACIADAVERVLEDEEHDPSCTDPCCVPDDDDVHAHCADEGHQVLTSGAAYYGVGQW